MLNYLLEIKFVLSICDCFFLEYANMFTIMEQNCPFYLLMRASYLDVCISVFNTCTLL